MKNFLSDMINKPYTGFNEVFIAKDSQYKVYFKKCPEVNISDQTGVAIIADEFN